MNLKDTFLRLRKVRALPCLTIVLPTHTTSPENQQDKVVLKNLAHQARERLLARYHERDLKGLFEQLDAVQAEIDHHHNTGCLALFLTNDTCEYLSLDIAVEPQVVIEDNFATRVLVQAMSGANSYYVLTLSQKSTHLWQVYRDQAHASHLGGFPVLDKIVQAIADEHDHWSKDEAVMRAYFETVALHLDAALAEATLPLVVAGSDRALEMFHQVSRHGKPILTKINGNFDNSTAADIGKIAWPKVQAAELHKQEESLQKLSVALSSSKVVVGAAQVYAMAKEGRGEILFVEEGYFEPGSMHGDHVAVGVHVGHAITDIVDEIMETVLEMKGQVIFVAPGMLADYGDKIALIERY